MEEVEADLDAWEAPPDIRDSYLSAEEDEDFAVFPQNWDTTQLFLSVSTQWRVAAGGAVLGLDYSAVDVAIQRLDLELTPDHFRGLQQMESAAMTEINKRLHV